MKQENLLEVKQLRTEFFSSKTSSVTAVNEISFSIGKGEILGLVGESGCGKSVTSLSIMGLLTATSGKVTKGEVLFEGKDLLKISEKEMREIRGGEMSMIFQEPMSSLNPAMRQADDRGNPSSYRSLQRGGKKAGSGNSSAGGDP